MFPTLIYIFTPLKYLNLNPVDLDLSNLGNFQSPVIFVGLLTGEMSGK